MRCVVLFLLLFETGNNEARSAEYIRLWLSLSHYALRGRNSSHRSCVDQPTSPIVLAYNGRSELVHMAN